MTPQREAILSVLHGFDAPVTAEEIHHRAHRMRPGVKLSTVYRTLELLKSLGLVSVVDVGDRKLRYIHESAEVPHFHLSCRSCGRVVGVGSEELREVAAAMLSRYQFEVNVNQVTLPGLCRECR